ncbi:MAG: DEAD/DEAH box helicase [Treponema sp.]|nr:MAG: DEAD/DEAH box helicase [Treponema sp.]
MTAFSRFDPRLQEKIVNNLGWTSLRPVQDLAGQAILDGKNCVVLAPTAGGKTEASIFPVLSGCLTDAKDGLRALYICPTRALINNQEERLARYAEMVGLGSFKWHGDVTPSQKKAFLKDPCEIVLTTPESLEVMLDSGSVPTAKLFENLRYVIVDEIHALAACDRGNHLVCVLERIRAYTKEDFQRIGLSATVGNPGDIMHWLQGSSTRETALVDPPKKVSKKDILIYLSEEDGELEDQIVTAAHGLKSLLFCESRRLAESIAGKLKKSGEPVFVHHSSLSREEREFSELQFSRGTEACIVCTSTMELGIDVGDLDKVLQVNTPHTVSSFLQRMGRTGRRDGTVSNTTFFIADEKYFLQTLAIIELARSGFVESVKTGDAAWHLLLHQIMALCLERGGFDKDEPRRLLEKASCFSGISPERFDRFVQFLISKELLHDDGRTVSMGLAAEKAFGRRNFMELYSVFSTPQEFEVIGVSGDVIGSIEWSFLEKLLESDASFYLAGQAWTVERIEWKKKAVFVVRAPAGKIPKWGSMSPGFLGYDVCRKMRDILVSNEDYPYLRTDTRSYLAALRTDKQEYLASDFAPIAHDHKGILWHTYAGGYVNSSIRYALKIELGIDVQATNEYVKISSETLQWNYFTAAVERMSAPGYWDNTELYRKMTTLMPNYRLSKFQGYLPDELQLKLVADTLLDIEAVKRFFDAY